MSTRNTQHTYSIVATGTTVRWHLTVHPKIDNNPLRDTSERDDSLQGILELVESTDGAQLDFGF